MWVNDNECIKAGLDPDEVERIAKGLSRYGRQAKKLGLTIFGGSGSGTLRIHDDPYDMNGRALIVASVNGDIDGGDGACGEDDEGLLRGE